MQNLTRAAAATVVLLATAVPAAAQYAPSSTTTSTTTTTVVTVPPSPTTTLPPPTTAPPTTTPTTIRTTTSTTPGPQSTTTTTAPPPAVLVTPPLAAPVVPGEPVTITAPSSVEFDDDAEPDVLLSGVGSDGTTVAPEITTTIVDGRLRVAVTVPPGTPEQILILTITAPDARGVLRTIVTLLPVAGTAPSSQSVATARHGSVVAGPAPLAFHELPLVPAADVPAVVRQLQQSVPDDATERTLLAELRADPVARLVVDGGRLALSTSLPGDDGEQDDSRPLVAALAVAIAGMGALGLRRMPATRSNR